MSICPAGCTLLQERHRRGGTWILCQNAALTELLAKFKGNHHALVGSRIPLFLIWWFTLPVEKVARVEREIEPGSLCCLHGCHFSPFYNVRQMKCYCDETMDFSMLINGWWCCFDRPSLTLKAACLIRLPSAYCKHYASISIASSDIKVIFSIVLIN